MVGSHESFDKQFSEYRDTAPRGDTRKRAAKVHGLFEKLGAAEDRLLEMAIARKKEHVRARMEAIDGLVSYMAVETEALQQTKLALMAETSAAASLPTIPRARR